MLWLLNLDELNNLFMAKESGIAKSIGDQKEQDMQSADLLLVNFLMTGKKISKIDAIIQSSEENKVGLTMQRNKCHATNVSLIFQQRISVIL